jgi:hypothetical protein
MMERINDESLAILRQLEVRSGEIDLSAAGVAGSSSTWTYLINDNPFSTLGLSLMANRNIGAAATTGFIAMMYLPITMIVSASIFVRRWMKRKRGR